MRFNGVTTEIHLNSLTLEVVDVLGYSDLSSCLGKPRRHRVSMDTETTWLLGISLENVEEPDLVDACDVDGHD